MARNLGAAAATAEARTPGPPRCLIFRSQPELGRRLNRHAQASAVAKVLALARQAPVAASLRVRMRRALLLLAASAFFVAWASPRFGLIWVSRFFSRRISCSPFLVSVLGCGVASLSVLEISLVSE
jgi:hypothetical protein